MIKKLTKEEVALHKKLCAAIPHIQIWLGRSYELPMSGNRAIKYIVDTLFNN